MYMLRKQMMKSQLKGISQPTSLLVVIIGINAQPRRFRKEEQKIAYAAKTTSIQQQVSSYIHIRIPPLWLDTGLEWEDPILPLQEIYIRSQKSSPLFLRPRMLSMRQVTKRPSWQRISLYWSTWHQYLPAVLYADRTTAKRTTGYSPFELVLGASPLLPIDSDYETWIFWQMSMKTDEDVVSWIARVGISDHTKISKSLTFGAALNIGKEQPWRQARGSKLTYSTIQ